MMPTTAATTAEDNKALARRFVEEFWNQGKLAVADELVAANFVRLDFASPDEVRGVEGIKQVATLFRSAFRISHNRTT